MGSVKKDRQATGKPRARNPSFIDFSYSFGPFKTDNRASPLWSRGHSCSSAFRPSEAARIPGETEQTSRLRARLVDLEALAELRLEQDVDHLRSRTSENAGSAHGRDDASGNPRRQGCFFHRPSFFQPSSDRRFRAD